MTPVMWYDDSSPFRSKDMPLRRKLEPSPSVGIAAPHNPHPRTTARTRMAQKMRREGYAVKTIASLLGVSRQRVSQMTKQHRP